MIHFHAVRTLISSYLAYVCDWSVYHDHLSTHSSKNPFFLFGKLGRFSILKYQQMETWYWVYTRYVVKILRALNGMSKERKDHRGSWVLESPSLFSRIRIRTWFPVKTELEMISFIPLVRFRCFLDLWLGMEYYWCYMFPLQKSKHVFF